MPSKKNSSASTPSPASSPPPSPPSLAERRFAAALGAVLAERRLADEATRDGVSRLTDADGAAAPGTKT